MARDPWPLKRVRQLRGQSWDTGERWRVELAFRWERRTGGVFVADVEATVDGRGLPGGNAVGTGRARFDSWGWPRRVRLDASLPSHRLFLAADANASQRCRLWLVDAESGDWDVIELDIKERELGRALERMVEDE